MSRLELEAERTILSEFKKVAEQVGRKVCVELSVDNKVKCTSCIFDPVSRASENIRCTVCGGTGWVTTSKRVTLTGWVSFEQKEFDHQKPGITDSNSCLLYIDRRTFFLFKSYFRRKFRLRINNKQYEIVSLQDSGIFRNDFMRLECLLVEGV